MNDPMNADEKRARLLAGVLHALPPRTAPPGLESRVLTELRRLAALPWWRTSFMHWPAPARAGFLVICAVLALVTLWAHPGATTGSAVVNETGQWALSWAHPLITLMASAGGIASVLARTIPPFWIYLVLTCGALLYAVLFGLGAAVYRTLYFHAADEMRL